jgi:hypothetical protein
MHAGQEANPHARRDCGCHSGDGIASKGILNGIVGSCIQFPKSFEVHQ